MHASLPAVLVLAAVATACAGSEGTPAASNVPLRIRVVDGVNMDVRDVPLLMAFDDLEARGYDVQPIYIAGNTLLADTLARGDAEIGIINNQTAWSAIANGADIRTVSEFTTYTGVVAAPTRITSCRELHGRPVGVPVITGFAPLLFNRYLRTECPGVEPEILVIAESASRTASILSGRLDASMVPGEELLKLQSEAPGRYHALAVASRRFPHIRVDGLQVRRAWAERHPDAVRALLAAQLQAHRLIRSAPDVLYAEAQKRLRLDPTTARTIGAAHLANGIWAPDGGLTPANVQATIDFLVESDALPPGLTPSDVADLSYLDAVLGEIGRGPDNPTHGMPLDTGTP